MCIEKCLHFKRKCRHHPHPILDILPVYLTRGISVPGGHREAGESILETAKRELQEETGAIRFDMKPLCVYSVTGKTRVNDTGEESFGLLCYAEITEFATELHSEMEKIVLLDELPEEWTYPLIQPKLIEKYLQMKNTIDFRLRA